jgi:hypothetical protein
MPRRPLSQGQQIRLEPFNQFERRLRRGHGVSIEKIHIGRWARPTSALPTRHRSRGFQSVAGRAFSAIGFRLFHGGLNQYCFYNYNFRRVSMQGNTSLSINLG